MRWLMVVSLVVLASAQAFAATPDEEMVRLTEKVEATAQGDAGNCPKMASDLRALHQQNAALIQRLRTSSHGHKLAHAYEPRLNAALQGTVAAVNTCGRDENVRQAVRDFPR